MAESRPPVDADIREKACDLNCDIFLAAGAGSGKTTVLVDRYMRALEAGIGPREIVAITFTRKAAAQMRQRLRGECRRKAKSGDLDTALRWRRVANELESAPISTIHGFCSRLLRRFAIRAGIDPQFEVLDERAEWLMRSRIITETVLEHLDENLKPAVRLFGEYTRSQVESIMEGLLRNREFFDEELRSPPGAADVRRHWEDIRTELSDEALRAVITGAKIAQALADLNDTAPLDPGTKFNQERTAVIEALSGAGALELDFRERRRLAERALEAASVRKSGAKPEQWGGRDEWDTVKDALNTVKKELRSWKQQTDQLDDDAVVDAAAQLTEAIWTEAAGCSEAYEEEKAAQSALDYVDLQLLARELLDDEQIRADCRNRYRQILVDEFQDTNDLQRDIVFALTGFNDPDREADAPRLFVVGDAKQSIYGFRNADVQVYRSTRRTFDHTPGNAEALALEVAFRSTASLMGYHNWLFEHETVMGPGEKPPYAARFEPLSAYREHRPDGKTAEILVTEAQAVEDERGEERRPNAEQRREAEAATLAARLLELHDTGFEIIDEEDKKARPMRWSDVALLFRAASNINIYENALRHNGIPFYTVGGAGFWARQEVMDLLNMVRALNNFNDDVAMAGVLRSPLFGFDDNELYLLSRHDGSLMDALESIAGGRWEEYVKEESPALSQETISRAEWAHRQLKHFRRISGVVSLSRLLEEIVDHTGYSAAMAAQFGGERRIANIRKLIDVSRGFERDGNYGMEEFVRYVETLSEAEEREGEAALGTEDADVVQLLTVHKAKGLEWPIVVIPDTTRDLRADRGPVVQSTEFGVCPRYEDEDAGRFGVTELIRSAELQRDLAEHRRLLYVAATRARDYLVVSAAVDPEESRSLPRDSWMAWVLDAAGQDCDSLQSQTIEGDGWSAEIVVQEPERLPPIGGKSRPLAETHEGLIRSGEPLEIADISPDLRSRVGKVHPSTADIERVSVTDLADYRSCPQKLWLKHVADLPGRSDGAGLGQLEGRASVLDVGTYAHLVLELIGRDGPDALEEAMEAATKAPDMQGLLSSEQKEQVRRWLREYLESESYGRMIAGASRLRSEVEVLFAVDGVHIEGKIDALAETGDGSVHLIDYKTGPGTDRTDAEYGFQIGLYCEGIRQATGEYPQTARLIYLEAQRHRGFDPQQTAGEMVEQARRLVSDIRRGHFASSPSEQCNRCNYSWACKHSTQTAAER